MRLYATAALAFCVEIPFTYFREFEETTVLNEFDKKNRSDLGYASLGQFKNKALYLSAFYESAEPLKPLELNPLSISRDNTRIWRRQLQKFLREQEIKPLGDIRFRLLADLDD